LTIVTMSDHTLLYGLKNFRINVDLGSKKVQIFISKKSSEYVLLIMLIVSKLSYNMQKKTM